MDLRKHIVFLAEHLSLGGAEIVLTQYLQYIDPSKYKVSLIVRDDLGEKNYLLSRIPSHIEVKTVFSPEDLAFFKADSSKTMVGRIQSLKKKKLYKKNLVAGFRKKLEELGPVDLVIDFMPVLNRFLGYFKDYKIILWMHGQKSHMPRWERYKYFIRMKKYDKIVLICEEMREQFIRFFPSVQNKFDVIYNPFDFDKIRTLAADDSELSETDRSLIQKNYVVSIGRLVPGKDFDTILEAARILKESGFEYTHYILGSGELLDHLQAKIEKYGLQHRVKLLGARKNPYIWLKKSKLFVHSALREGLPTVLIESLILDIPVIACTCETGPREILEDGKSGALYPVGDFDALAESIQKVLTQKSLQMSYLENGSRRVWDFHFSKVMPKFYYLVESLL